MALIETREVVLKTGEACRIRNAVEEDARDVHAHTFRLLSEEPESNVTEADEFEITEEQERKWIKEHREKPGWLAIVAEVGEETVGLLNFSNGARRRLAHRGSLGMSVAREWRRRGVGTALLDTLLGWAEESPLIEKVALAVIEGNEPAIALYRKLGFEEEGRRRNEIKLGTDRYRDDLLMYRMT